MKKILLLLLPWLVISVPMKAWITGTAVDGLTYNVISSSERTVEVGLSSTQGANTTSVTIPATVVINGTTYTVTKIANYGFTSNDLKSNQTNLYDDWDWDTDCSLYTNELIAQMKSNGSLTLPNTSKQNYDGGAGLVKSEDGVTGNRFLNTNLISVSFTDDCQITEIGFAAFSGCTNLKTFRLPYSVSTLGIQAFMACINLEEFIFNVGGNPVQSQLRTIPKCCFSGCRKLTQLVIPEGITTIANRACQYLFSLVSISLPSTLTTIGTHFLCEAHSLESITIPSSVTSIDGALFHGCCSLKEAYFLGSPSYLGTVSNTDTDETFGFNGKFAGQGVQNCKFYVYPEYLPEDYATTCLESDGTEHKDNSGSGTYLDSSKEWYNFLTVCADGTSNSNFHNPRDYCENGNSFCPMVGVVRTIPTKWVTCTLYKAMTKAQVIATFGEDAKIAYMTNATYNSTLSGTQNEYYNMYDLTFTVVKMSDLIDNDIVIHANMPFMLRATKEANVTIYNSTEMKGGYQTGETGDEDAFGSNYATEADETMISADKAVFKQVTQCTDGSALPSGLNAAVIMLGKYTTYYLQKWEHIFKNPGKTVDGVTTYDHAEPGYMGFYRMPSANYQSIDNGRCFWHINEAITQSDSNEVKGNGYTPSRGSMIYDVEEDINEATGIEELHVKVATFDEKDAEGVYTLTGQKINSDNMTKGFYIVNGKKVYVK